MKSNEILYGKSDDERYTKEYAVEPILKYIPRDWVVWCLFDKEESNFVKLISRRNKVIYSHIDTGQIFLNGNQMNIGTVLLVTRHLKIRECSLKEYFHLINHLH